LCLESHSLAVLGWIILKS